MITASGAVELGDTYISCIPVFLLTLQRDRGGVILIYMHIYNIIEAVPPTSRQVLYESKQASKQVYLVGPDDVCTQDEVTAVVYYDYGYRSVVTFHNIYNTL